jgi:hypothetical protein
MPVMPELAPISAALDARVEPCPLDRGFVVVDPAFAWSLGVERWARARTSRLAYRDTSRMRSTWSMRGAEGSRSTSGS